MLFWKRSWEGGGGGILEQKHHFNYFWNLFKENIISIEICANARGWRPSSYSLKEIYIKFRSKKINCEVVATLAIVTPAPREL